MPDTWDPVIYRERAKAWREKAATLPEGDRNRASCLEIAEGYEKLATQLELRCKLERRLRPGCRPGAPAHLHGRRLRRCPAAVLEPHGCTRIASRDVMTTLVRRLPQLVQRNLRSFTGTSPRPASMMACKSASA
jgi:hypothetical protein